MTIISEHLPGLSCDLEVCAGPCPSNWPSYITDSRRNCDDLETKSGGLEFYGPFRREICPKLQFDALDGAFHGFVFKLLDLSVFQMSSGLMKMSSEWKKNAGHSSLMWKVGERIFAFLTQKMSGRKQNAVCLFWLMFNQKACL
jgi:hypothetical protein